jgi:hypothetical protein
MTPRTPSPPAAPPATGATIPRPYYVTDAGEMVLRFHAGQWEAYDSRKRFIFVLAGTQSGKTAFGPHWLHREIYDPIIGKGGIDYLAVTATYDLFKLKFLPELREVFEHQLGTGRYWAGSRVIELRNPKTGQFSARRADDPMWGRIILRSAESKGGLESGTAGAALLDEAGMPQYTAQDWQAIRRRLSLTRGRILAATTLYILHNWLRQEYDKWKRGDNPDADFIHFNSVINPAFSREEYSAAIRDLPGHVINMQYRGVYDTPPGMIYDIFSADRHIVRPFHFHHGAPVYVGMDYGGINTTAVKIVEINNVCYVVKEYIDGNKTAAQHSETILKWEPTHTAGGSWSEGQWRREFRSAGLPVQRPRIPGVWEGINTVYALLKSGRLQIFDTCERTIAQFNTYARRLDPQTNEPTQEIQNKQTYHFLDAIRYIAPLLSGTTSGGSRSYL